MYSLGLQSGSADVAMVHYAVLSCEQQLRVPIVKDRTQLYSSWKLFYRDYCFYMFLNMEGPSFL